MGGTQDGSPFRREIISCGTRRCSFGGNWSLVGSHRDCLRAGDQRIAHPAYGGRPRLCGSAGFFCSLHVAFSSYVTPNSGLFHVSEFLGTVGNSGVDLFFIISGYLIYGAVMRPRIQLPSLFVPAGAKDLSNFPLCLFHIHRSLGVFKQR